MPTAKTAETKLLEQLAAPFPVDDVKQRTAGGGRKLDYISIDATIRRLNEVLGTGWSFSILDSSLGKSPDSPDYLATVVGRIQGLGKTADGVGASAGRDPDDTFKTALAEALKKAGHQFGIGLYLWDEKEREVVARQREERDEAGAAVEGLKAALYERSVAAGFSTEESDPERIKAALAAFLDKILGEVEVEPESLENPATLKALLDRLG